MALYVSNISYTNLSVDQDTHIAYYDMVGSWVEPGPEPGEPPYQQHIFIYDDGADYLNCQDGTSYNDYGEQYALSGGWNPYLQSPPVLQFSVGLPADDTGWSWKAAVMNGGVYTYASSATSISKTYAVAGSVGTPTQYQSQSAYHTAYIRAAYTPATLTSTATVWIDYKRTADSTWTASSTTTGLSGYASANCDRTITGLSASTSYDFRLRMTRDTNATQGATSYTSSTYTFTTMAAVPTITTAAATNLTNSSATLNATLDTNGVDCDVTFLWDTASHGPGDSYAYDTPGGETSPAFEWSTDGDKAVAKGITGLTASTTHYFRAKVVYSGGTIYGSELTFATTADPAVEAAEEARMQVYEYKRKYGVALTACPLFFTLQTPSGTNSNTFVVAATVGAADCLISKDGGAFAQTTNQPTTLGNGYQLVLTATEMEADEIDIVIKDAAGGPDFRDAHLRVITHLQLGTIDIDAATGTKGTNTDAVTLLGYGTGKAISATGGATSTADIGGVIRQDVQDKGTISAVTSTTDVTLASSATPTEDYYNGSILVITGGTGAGQCRLITDYAANRRATLGRAFKTGLSTDSTYLVIPGPDVWTDVQAELTSVPAAGGSFAVKVQALYQRFFFKRTQTAAKQQLLKADGTTPWAEADVTDSAGTQTITEHSAP